MNVFKLYSKSYEFTQKQLELLFGYLDEYSKTPDGMWLSTIDYKKCKFIWSPALEGSYVMAAKPLVGSSVLVCPNGNNPDYWVSLITPAIVHELRHMWQKSNNIIKYTLCSLISRVVLILSEDMYMAVPTESDAFDQQSRMEDFIGGI